MSKIIIGIHGLGNKPPAEIIKRWWQYSIADGFKALHKPYHHLKFELVYWRDVIHPKPLVVEEIDETNPLYLDEPYSSAGKIVRGIREPRQQKIREYIEKQINKLLLNDDLTVNFSAITDYITHRFFNDLDVYYMSDQPVSGGSALLPRKAIRKRLIETLRRHRKKEILLIAHSMGSIIAYDVLSAGDPDIHIDTLVTCGSPLGIPVIKSKIRAERKLTAMADELTVPDAITRQWFNLSDLHDRVAIDFKLADDYSPNQAGVTIEDLPVTNTYEYRGEKNPHKAYGYLRTPEMTEIIYDFFCHGHSKLENWFIEKFYRFFRKKKSFPSGI